MRTGELSGKSDEMQGGGGTLQWTSIPSGVVRGSIITPRRFLL